MSIFSGFFKPKPAASLTRLFFASDLHGSERTFRKFLAAARHYNAGVLLMGGDMVGKVAVPIIREAGGRYRVRLLGRTEQIADEAALAGLRDRLGTLGYYGKVMEEEEFHEISTDSAKTETLFRELATARLRSWVGLAEERLKGSGVRLYMMGGNDDEQEILDSVAWEGCESVVYCEGKAVEIDAHHVMVSDGHSNLTPWSTPRELSEAQLCPLLESLARQVPNPSRAIFNFHVPPVDSTLDTCPQLDWTVDPPAQIIKGGQPVLHGAGRRSVRDVIERHQPLLSLHGHIHESGGVTRLGRTTAVNPGSEYGEGILRGCLITLAPDEVRSFQMTAG
jgi:uncharacterized protein